MNIHIDHAPIFATLTELHAALYDAVQFLDDMTVDHTDEEIDKIGSVRIIVEDTILATAPASWAEVAMKWELFRDKLPDAWCLGEELQAHFGRFLQEVAAVAANDPMGGLALRPMPASVQ